MMYGDKKTALIGGDSTVSVYCVLHPIEEATQ